MQSLPKVELHIHLEGTLEPELIFDLAARNGVTLPYDLEGLKGRYEFTDLQSFLDLYYENLGVVRTREDFADLTRAYFRRAAAGGVRHVELFFDPQAHTARGIPLAIVTDGITEVLRTSESEFGVSSSLIACFLRDRPVDEALAILDELIDLRVPLVGIGLDSAEVGHPPSDFVAVFARASAVGLRLVAHAGEEGPSDYVWEALALLNVERVDHGIRSLEDAALVAHLIERGIPLTMCPLSNVRLGVIDELSRHPLPRMLELGLKVCINSDDPAYFGGYIDDNYTAVATAFSLDDDQLATLARNAVDAAFIDADRRTTLHRDIDAWLARRP